VLDAEGAILMAIPFAATPTDVRVVGQGVTPLSPQLAQWWDNIADPSQRSTYE
jgi:uncharacterized membrane protein YfbV (UPF0208 family)